MARIPIVNVGAVGMNQDIARHRLPPEVWTNTLNMRARNGSMQKVFGRLPVLGTPSAAPVWLMPAFTATNDFWVYGAVGALYAVDGTTHATLRTTLGGARSNRWNGGMFGGIGIMNNGIADPQEWNPPALATATVDLTNWPANTTCKVIRPFDRYLVAGDITVSGNNFPQRVRWSASADISTVPSSWDVTDPTNDAGQWDLAESRGAIMDFRALGPINMIYKEDETHAMTHIGGQFIFDFKRRFKTGILAQDCVVEWRRQHVVALQDDVIIHDGFQQESLLQNKMRKWYTGRPDPTYSGLSYIAPCGDEMWVCFAEAGVTEPNIALVVNMVDGTTTVRELPGAAFIASAPLDPDAGGSTFDDITIPFDQVVGQFGQRNFAPGRDRCVAALPAAVKLHLMDQEFDNDGVNFMATLERSGLALVGQDRQGNPVVDQSMVKLGTKIWPKVTFLNGTVLNVYLGAAQIEDGPVTWQGPQVYDPSISPFVEFDVEGPYLAVKFETSDGTWWQLEEYKIELEVIGEHTP